jgi:D-3-phosphoglycerate dehydrogenase
MKPEELGQLLSEGVEGLVAGTEPITRAVIEGAPRLRVIARVGVGLDNVDLKAAREAGIVVTYTPHAPALAVSELTVGLIIDLLRRITSADRSMRRGTWTKHLGLRLRERTIGVAGVGRIGKRVINLLKPFGCRILPHDSAPDYTFSDMLGLQWVDKETLLHESDLISLHLPLTQKTFHWIDASALARMKSGACIINSARGPIIDESAVQSALTTGTLGGLAIDVYDKEPYDGPLRDFEQVVLTSHMGAATQESRFEMELEAARDCVRVLLVQKPLSPVPEDSETLPEYS